MKPPVIKAVTTNCSNTTVDSHRLYTKCAGLSSAMQLAMATLTMSGLLIPLLQWGSPAR